MLRERFGISPLLRISWMLNAQVLNAGNISREAEVPRSTVEGPGQFALVGGQAQFVRRDRGKIWRNLSEDPLMEDVEQSRFLHLYGVPLRPSGIKAFEAAREAVSARGKPQNSQPPLPLFPRRPERHVAHSALPQSASRLDPAAPVRACRRLARWGHDEGQRGLDSAAEMDASSYGSPVDLRRLYRRSRG